MAMVAQPHLGHHVRRSCPPERLHREPSFKRDLSVFPAVPSATLADLDWRFSFKGTSEVIPKR